MICFSPTNRPNRNVVATKTASYGESSLCVCMFHHQIDQMKELKWDFSHTCSLLSLFSCIKMKKNPVFPSNLKRLRWKLSRFYCWRKKRIENEGSVSAFVSRVNWNSVCFLLGFSTDYANLWKYFGWISSNCVVSIELHLLHLMAFLLNCVQWMLMWYVKVHAEMNANKNLLFIRNWWAILTFECIILSSFWNGGDGGKIFIDSSSNI